MGFKLRKRSCLELELELELDSLSGYLSEYENASKLSSFFWSAFERSLDLIYVDIIIIIIIAVAINAGHLPHRFIYLAPLYGPTLKAALMTPKD